MLEKLRTELRIRGFSQRTIQNYLWNNENFIDFIKKEPQDVTNDDIKAYMVFMMDKNMKPSSISLALSALKFYYEKILEKDIFKKIQMPKMEKRIPNVLSKDEIQNLISSIDNKKHKLLVMLMYSAGLRVSETVSLKVKDLNFSEKVGKVIMGKGKKDRYFILSETVIKEAQQFLKKRNNADQTNEYLFMNAESHISTRMAQYIVQDAANKARIEKRVYCHALRSSFATHLLEAGTDIRIIQELLGHSNLSTTERYTKVSFEQIKKVKSPFDSFK